MLEVCGIVLDHGAGPFEILRESDRGNELVNFPCVEGFVDFAPLRRGRSAARAGVPGSICSSSVLSALAIFAVVSNAPLSSAVVRVGECLIVLVEHGKVSPACGGALLASRARRGSRDSRRDLRDCVPLTNLSPPIIFDRLEAFRDVTNLGGGGRLGLVSMFNHLKYDGIVFKQTIVIKEFLSAREFECRQGGERERG